MDGLLSPDEINTKVKYIPMNDVTVDILQGDCLTILKTLPKKSINCCVTSPPYYGLRDYGVDGQLGLEPTPEEYIKKLVAVFREVRQVLRDDGTLWVNIGDSYNGSGGAGGDYNQGGLKEGQPKYPGRDISGLKPKDLIGIPWMLAFALRADGWYLRQDIIWNKPNPMPESVRDRCTKAHEYIFLLSKSKEYFYDHEAIREPIKAGCDGSIRALARDKAGPVDISNGATIQERIYDEIKGANKRSVWTVTTKPYKAAHFATFPKALIIPCIKAGCPRGGTVLDPFFGAGTTGVVSRTFGRSCIGIELNPKYCEIAENRLAME